MVMLNPISLKDTPHEKCEKLADFIVQCEQLAPGKFVRVLRLMHAQDISCEMLAEYVEFEDEMVNGTVPR